LVLGELFDFGRHTVITQGLDSIQLSARQRYHPSYMACQQ
jgi:hypothetical protein